MANTPLIVVILIVFGLVYVSFMGVENYSVTPRWIYFSILALITLYLSRKSALTFAVPSVFWWAFIIFYVVSSYWSYNTYDTLVRAIPLSLAPIIVAQAERLDSKVFLRNIGAVLLVLLLPVVLYCLFQIFPDLLNGSFDHQKSYTYALTFGHRNQFSHFLVLSLPLIGLGYSKSDKTWWRIVVMSGFLMIILLIVLLQNRTSYLVLFVIYPTAFLLYIGLFYKGRIRKIIFGTLFIGVCSALLIISTPLKNRIPFYQQLTETSFGSGNERVRLWKNSLDIWRHQPYFGIGSGDWKIEILKTPLIHTQAETGNIFYQRAHNDFIQVLTENGLIGATFFLLFFVTGIYFILRKSIDPKIKTLCLSGIFAYILISSFSFPLEKIELLILMMIFITPIIGESLNINAIKRIIKPLSAVFIITLFMASMKWMSLEKDFFEYNRKGSISKLKTLNKDVYTIDPTSTPTWWEIGNHEFNRGNFIKALDHFRKGSKYNPYHVHLLNNIGSSHYALGQKDSARVYYKKALELNPGFVESLMNISALNFNNRKTDLGGYYIDSALMAILNVPIEQEPENYKAHIEAIGKAKCNSIIRSRDEPEFELFLIQNMNDGDFLYRISKDARKSSRAYEDELRYYYSSIITHAP